MNAIEVFISYSRKDAAVVRLLAQFLRAANLKVFRDEDNVQPGDDWQEIIVTTLDQATLVYVMWCCHAQSSTWVTQETEKAIQANKRIVPILLDKTPLTDQLGRYQAIDFSDKIKHSTFIGTIGSAITTFFRGLLSFLGEAKGCAIPLLLLLALVSLPVYPTSSGGGTVVLAGPVIAYLVLGLTLLAAALATAILLIYILRSLILFWWRRRYLAKELASTLVADATAYKPIDGKT